MLQVSALYIYPIKSLGGIQVKQALVTDRGFEYDRRWMLIDTNNRFISQREFAKMALLKVAIETDYLLVTNTQTKASVKISLNIVYQQTIIVSVWDDVCKAQLISNEIDNWFSAQLGITCRLVYMPDESIRPTDPEYTPEGNITSLSDGYPFMMIGQSSLNELNSRLENELPMNRFRPNIVFTGGEPFEEDTMDNFAINNICFNGVKLCARCNITTIDQDSAIAGKEPLRTLAKFRAKNKKILFGQNLIHTGTGMISVGDEITVSSIHHKERFIV